MIQFTKTYDLEERTAKFGGEIIQFCKNIQETTISRPIINQLIRWQEAQSLTMIFQKITSSLNKRV